MEELLKKKEKDFRVLEAKLQRLEQSYLATVKQNRSLQTEKKDLVMFLEDQGFVNPHDATLDVSSKLEQVRLWAQNMATDRKTLESIIHMIFPNDRRLGEMSNNPSLPIDFEEVRLCWIAYEELYSQGAAAVQSAARDSILNCERTVEEVKAEKAELEETLEDARREIQRLNREKACLLVERLNEQTSSAHSTTSAYNPHNNLYNHHHHHHLGNQLPGKLTSPPPPPPGAVANIDGSRSVLHDRNYRRSVHGNNISTMGHLHNTKRPSSNVIRGGIEVDQCATTNSNGSNDNLLSQRENSHANMLMGDAVDKQQIVDAALSLQPLSDDIGVFERDRRGTSSHSCGSNSVCGTDYADPAAPPHFIANNSSSVSPVYTNNQRIVPVHGGSAVALAGRLLTGDTFGRRAVDNDTSAGIEALQTNTKLRESIHELKLEKERMALDLQSSRAQAKEMLTAKDLILEKLRKQVSSMQENNPTVQLLQKLAETQASREYQLLEMNAKVNKMSVALQEAEESMLLERKQTKLLKDTVRDLQGSPNREDVNFHYLKNVIVQYMEFVAKGDTAASRLIPVICQILLLDSKECEKILSYSNKQTGSSMLLGFKGR